MSSSLIRGTKVYNLGMNLINDVLYFLDTFVEKMKNTGIDVSELNLDHVAYQADSLEDYEKLKPFFENLSDYDHVAIVGDRRVAVFGLKEPIEYRGNRIVALELLEPKKGEICKSGWEHAEYVLNEPYKSFIEKYPNLNWNTSSIERSVYSHLKLRLDVDIQVKFHMFDILETIKLEEK